MRYLLRFCSIIGSLIVVAVVFNYTYAAVTAGSIITAQTPNRGLLQFLNASTPGTYLTLYTAGLNGSKCNALWTDNNDNLVTHVVSCQLVNGGLKQGGFSQTTTSPGANTIFIAQNMIPITTVGIPPSAPIDSDGNPYIQLISGDTLQCTFNTAITSGDQVDVHTQCGDF